MTQVRIEPESQWVESVLTYELLDNGYRQYTEYLLLSYITHTMMHLDIPPSQNTWFTFDFDKLNLLQRKPTHAFIKTHTHTHTLPLSDFQCTKKEASNHTAPAHQNDRIERGEKPFRLAQLRTRVCFQSRNTVPRVDKAALLSR